MCYSGTTNSSLSLNVNSNGTYTLQWMAINDSMEYFVNCSFRSRTTLNTFETVVNTTVSRGELTSFKVNTTVLRGELTSFKARNTLCCCITPQAASDSEREDSRLCTQAIIPTGNFTSTCRNTVVKTSSMHAIYSLKYSGVSCGLS